jgi:hypothetical protein
MGLPEGFKSVFSTSIRALGHKMAWGVFEFPQLSGNLFLMNR